MEKVQLSDFLWIFHRTQKQERQGLFGDWPNIGLTDLHY